MKRILCLAILAMLALSCALTLTAAPSQAATVVQEDGLSISRRTTDVASRILMEAVAKSLDRPLAMVNGTVNSPDWSYNSYMQNGTGTGAGNVSQRIPYVIDGKAYDMANGTADLSAINTYTTLGNNTQCMLVFTVDAAGHVNATQGPIVGVTAEQNATGVPYPDTPHGVAVIGALKLAAPKTSTLVPGTTALVQGVNAWNINCIQNPRYGLKP